MKLSEIFTQLSYGELSQVSLGGAETGKIDASNYNQVVAHIDLGLSALYKRFPLKESLLTFALQQGQYLYKLSSTEDIQFILSGNEEEFADDILKIERVLTGTGWEMGLNDASDGYSCFTPTSTTLRVPISVVDQMQGIPEQFKTTNLTVVYRASHPILSPQRGTINPAQIEVELPYSHLEALLMFVASRVHNPIGMSNEFHAGNSYYAKYEAACQLLEIANVNIDQGSQSTRLSRKGWV